MHKVGSHKSNFSGYLNNNYDEDCYDLTNKRAKRKASRKKGSGNNRQPLKHRNDEDKEHRRNFSIGK